MKYAEGDWFAVPLARGGYGVGLVARCKRGIVFGYFFGPRRKRIPMIEALRDYAPRDAVLVGRFGHLGIAEGDWPIIGSAPDWDRAQWPMPHFKRVDEDAMKAWEEVYSEDDPNLILEERRASFRDVKDLPDSGLMGSEFAAERLSELIS